MDASLLVVIGTLLTILATFIATARRDRAQRDNTAVKQWMTIAESAMAAKLAAEARMSDALNQVAHLEAQIAKLEIELSFWKPNLGGKP